MLIRSPTLYVWMALVALALCGGTACGSGSDSNPGDNDAEAGAGGNCSPVTCESANVECGTVENNCGRIIRCGDDCGAGSSAGGAAGAGGECIPSTCAAERKNCGTIDDGCGRELDCGTCSEGTCGAEEPNVCGCAAEMLTAGPRSARFARSAGFSGTAEAYVELFDIVCETVDDCAEACIERGGEVEMCDASQCLPNANGPNDCLPPPVWSNLESIQFASNDVSETTQLVTVDGEYRDRLLTSQFELEVPDDAEIRGITVDVRRASQGPVADDSLRIIKDGRVGEAERASSLAWDSDLTWVTYGGPEDLWGEEWSPEDIRSKGFGVALAAAYTRTAGNARAYVDEVSVTVHYSVGSCP